MGVEKASEHARMLHSESESLRIWTFGITVCKTRALLTCTWLVGPMRMKREPRFRIGGSNSTRCKWVEARSSKGEDQSMTPKAGARAGQAIAATCVTCAGLDCVIAAVCW